MPTSLTKSCLFAAGFGLFALVLLASPATAARDCIEAMRIDEPREYSCEFKTQNGRKLEGSLEFEMLDDDTFTAVFVADEEEGDGTLAYCSCRSKASLQAGRFGNGKSFICVNPLGENSASVFIGTPNGNGRKIKKGEAWSASMTEETADFIRARFKCEAEKKNKKNKDDDSDEDEEEGKGKGKDKDKDDDEDDD